MRRSHRGKHFVYRNYWWIAVFVAAAAIIVVVRYGPPDRGSLIATTLGTTLTFCYFVQKQSLDELKLFNDLFTSFNRRYNAMNAKLEDIYAGKEMSDVELKKALVAYFNLCAEEYLFVEEGYIHSKVWESWCCGMVYYLGNDRIRKVWDEEMKSSSYYGLTLDTVLGASGRPLRNSQASESRQ